MKSKTITITSKNQITLPAEYVRKMKLSKSRNLIATLKNNKLELKPAPSLQELMQPHWDHFHQTHPNFSKLSDDDMHSEVSDAYKQYFEQNPGV